MELNALLKEFGYQTGMGDLSLDENNMCRLIFDDHLVVDIELMPDKKNFFIYGIVGKVPAGKKGAFYARLLDANLFGKETGDACFGLDKNREEIILYRKFNCEHLDYAAFETALEAFVSAFEHWKKQLASEELTSTEEIDLATQGMIRA